jgi:predicted RNase H-like nuclease (RuvC/YqgF family)
MSNEISQFQAQHAFTYVDTYRKSILKSAAILTDSIGRLEKQYWDESQSDPQMVAELRGMQDALKYVAKGEEPGLVTLGDINVERQPGDNSATANELSDCRASVESLMSQREQLEQRVRQIKNQDSELQAYVVQARQQAQLFRRRLLQSNSTFVVVVTAMFIVILVQLYMLWSR